MEIGKLAVYLRAQDQLDTAGVIQAQMAEDLSDTVPAAMPETFRRLRLSSKFFPRPVEILEVYSQVQKERGDAARAADRKREDAELAAALEDKRLHPEKYTTIAEIVKNYELKSMPAVTKKEVAADIWPKEGE